MSNSSAPLLQARELVVGYQGHGILPPVDLAIQAGEFWLLVGRNGSGKSTLLRTLLTLLAPIAGDVACAAHAQVAYLSQRLRLDPVIPLRSLDVVAQGVEQGRSFLRPWLTAAQRQRVAAALALTGTEALAKQRFATLSEGQKQRVLLAQAVATGANLLVLDEPTAAMDMTAELEAMQRLDDLRRQQGTAVLLVSHDLGAAMQRADRVIFVDAEHQHVAIGPPEVVAQDPHFRYQFALLASLPEDCCSHEPKRR